MLSQAGRAIASAYAEEDWQYREHGITPDRENLRDWTVKAFDDGAFPVVCTASKSPTLHGKVAFNALSQCRGWLVAGRAAAMHRRQPLVRGRGTHSIPSAGFD